MELKANTLARNPSFLISHPSSFIRYKSDEQKNNVTLEIFRISIGYMKNDVMTFFSNFYIRSYTFRPSPNGDGGGNLP